MADEQDLPIANDGLMDLSGFMDQRDAAEEAMAKKVAENRLAQVPDAGDMAQEPFAEPVEQPVVETPPDAPPAEKAAPEAPREPVEPAGDEPRYKVKVDGQEIEVPLSKLLADYRVREASDRRFEEAARLRREAEELARRAQTQPEPRQQTQPERAPDDIAERKKKIKEAIQYGDDAQLDEVAEMLVSRGGQQVDVAAVERMVEERLAREARNRAFTELTQKPENRPVFEDEDLARLSRGRTVRLMAEEIVTAGGDPAKVNSMDDRQIAAAFSVLEHAGRTRPQMELIQEAVDYTRERFLPNAPKAPAPVDLEARRQRKASLPQLPVATGARAQPPAAPQRKTPGQIVDEERKSRGQATFNVGAA